MARYVGAIDQGTTSTRFIVFDRGGNMISSAQKETGIPSREPRYGIQRCLRAQLSYSPNRYLVPMVTRQAESFTCGTIFRILCTSIPRLSST